ncbi:MAG: cytochrome P450 [Anaerolineae bacterium]|nr:cytochrome P450 [Anaerolineae bacterium]MDQ7033985.1 cytochrome P450 [Anaerolineae bacterium]
MVSDKVKTPQNDLTSDLIRMRHGDDNIITLNEIASCMITLLVAGHETTTAQITNGILHWLTQREEWERLCQHPDAIPQAVEEMMRYDPSVCAWRRYVVEDTQINGVTIPKSANLLLMLNSANRDETIFPESDTIDIDRDNVKDHLSFGYGIHYCVGAPLARLEMVILFEELTRRLPTLRLVPEQTLSYTRNISFRSPTSLHVAW